MFRLNHTVLALCVAFTVVGCKGSTSVTQDAGPVICSTLADCAANEVCLNSACVPVCHSNSECATGLVCEEGICLAPACGSDSQCQSGQACLNGKCTSGPAASQIDHCTVTPNPAVVRAGATSQLKAVAYDSTGTAVHFEGFTWSATGPATVDATGLVTGTGAGSVTATATVTGTTKTCTSAVTAYAAAGADAHVTVINIHTKQPVVGAKVVIDTATTAQATDANGVATFTGLTGTHDIHVFASGYGYTSFIQTTSKDLLVPLTPYVTAAVRSGFQGHMCESRTSDPACTAEGDFSPLQDQGQGVHLAFFGSSIPNSLLDLSVDTLVGPLHSVTLTIANTTTTTSLPYGLVLGIGSQFFGTQDYRVFADGGARDLWGLGGNVNLTDVVKILSPLLQGGGTTNIDIGTLLPKLLGFFGRFQAGANVAVTAPANAATPTFTKKTIGLTTPMRLRLTANSQNLPKVDGTYVDGVIAVAGAMNYPMGFVPLGLSAGIKAKDNSGKILDPTCDTNSGNNEGPCETNTIPFKIASPNGGTEGSKIGLALLAVNFGGFTPGSATRIAVSGQLKTLDKVDYVAPPGAAPTYAFPAFPTLPATSSVVVSKGSRQLNITGDADSHTQIYRFELANNARLTWNIWMDKVGASRSVTLPDPSAFGDATIKDPFQDALDDAGKSGGPSGRLVALQLTDTAKTASDLETFGNLTLDAIGSNLSAFTVLQVPVSP